MLQAVSQYITDLPSCKYHPHWWKEMMTELLMACASCQQMCFVGTQMFDLWILVG
jgi:hypothetical protein